MNDKTIFVSDNGIFYHLLSNTEQETKSAQIILDYQSYRNLQKKIILTPTTFKCYGILFEKNNETYLYFLNYFEEAKFVNNLNDEEKEVFLLLRALKVGNEVALISNKYQGNTNFMKQLDLLKIPVFGIQEASQWVWAKREFRDFMSSLQNNK